MQDVPKIVRTRLQAARPATDSLSSGNHPGADALTAFAERLLSERERAVVIEHLARCADCRDIVALALPATEAVQTATRASARGWLSWPALRWGFVAAGIVAIASLGIVQYQKRPDKMASKSPARVDVAANETANRGGNQAAYQTENQLSAPPASSRMTKKAENLQPPPASALVNSESANDSTSYGEKSKLPEMAPRAYVPQRGESHHGAAPPIGGPLPHGPMLANQYQQQQNTVQTQASTPAAASPFAKQQAAGDLSADMRVPAAPETVEVESQAIQLETKGRNLDAAQIKDLPAAPKPADEEYASARIGKAKPAVTAETASGGALTSQAAVPAPAPSQAAGGLMLTSSAPIPRWTISSAGSLQRSFDRGITWQVVDVNSNPAYSVDATSVQISEKTSRAKSKEASKALKRDTSAPIFRAVAATGAEVWAGGSGGALYHSPDAGNHWTRVTPTSSGAALAGDIVSLEFPDTQHGKISTSTGEVWTTGDAGQTWQKQ